MKQKRKFYNSPNKNQVMVFFEILAEDGFQRRCRISFGSSKDRVKTPLLVIPINNFVLKIDKYTKFLKRNTNIMLQVFDSIQDIPGFLSKLNIICDLNTNYYAQNGSVEDFINYQSTSLNESGILYIASKNCPSSSISEELTSILQVDFCREVINQLKNKDPNSVNIQNIGLGFDLNAVDNLYSQIKSIIKLVNSQVLINNIKLLKLGGIFDNFMYYKEIIDAIFYLKESIPSDVILMASGKIDPSKFALLSYIGIDLIDGTYLLYAGFSDLYYNGDGMKWLRQIKGIDDIPCSCESCLKLIQNISKNPSITDKFEGKIVNDLIAIHNLEFGLNEIKRIKSKIELGVLRSYLEKRCMESTFLMSSLRYIDSLVPNPIEEVQRLYKNSHLICSNTLSYQEPQIVRFRKRVEKKYYPNPDTKICVFLPCSMVKPYSKSKSHRKYIKAIKSGALEDFDKISQIIITSPLGLVPRELEGVYPAAHYDISVTGDWDHEETAITAKCIASFIRKLPEEIPIIAHLSQGYLKAFENARKIVENNHTYIITSDLEGLKYEIRNQLQKINIRSKQQLEDIRIKESLSPEENMIKIIADFQFGYGAGELLIGSAARFLQSRNEKFKEIYGYESFGKVNLGRYIRKSGQIKLSYLGGERLTAIHGNSITLNTTDIKGSSIFKPAVEKIDEKLCSGDDVIIFTPTRDYYGIGEMIVNAKTALKLRRGAVVKIRKKKKK